MQRFVAGLLFVMCLLVMSARAEDTWLTHDAYLRAAINDCLSADLDRTSCRHFPGKTLVRLFGIGDFCTERRCLRGVEIEWKLRHNPDKWRALGAATSQAVLDEARALAMEGKVVLAVHSKNDRGQVALVMPGAAVASGSWGLNVPIAVAARVDEPKESVYGKGLSWIFSDPATVNLYVRR